MNHLKIYESIIKKVKFENRIKIKRGQENYIYFENHHIIPRCLGGGENKENLVLLTAREHYVCHKLLTYIYPKNEGIICGFFRLTYDCRNRKVSSRDYAYAKDILSNQRSGKPTWSKNKKFSPTHRNNISISRIIKGTAKGEKNPMFGKHHSKESNEKNGEKHKGNHHNEESKQKISIVTSGENNPMFGTSIYDVWLIKYGKDEADVRYINWKNKQKETALKKEIKICPHCGISGKGAGIIRYHFDNCKLKKGT